MKLTIQSYKQKHKLACGPACLKMVFQHYGKRISEAKILKALGGTTKFGTYSTDLSVYAAQQGFKVSCFTYNLKLIDPAIAKLPSNQIIKKLQAIKKTTSKQFDKGVLSSTIKLLQSDVRWFFEPPRLDKIKGFLKRKIPVIIAINYHSLKNTQGDITKGHFIVLRSFNKNSFFYTDPWDGKPHQLSADQLFFSLASNVLNSSAYMIIIEPIQAVK